MNLKAVSLGILGIILFWFGYSYGSYKTTNYYQEKIIERLMEERRLIQENQAKEEQWRNETLKMEEEYNVRIRALEHSRDAVIARLRQQLDEYNKWVSTHSNSSSKSDAKDGRTNVSEEIKRLVDFSDKCSRRTDELIVQVNALQEWINKITY